MNGLERGKKENEDHKGETNMACGEDEEKTIPDQEKKFTEAMETCLIPDEIKESSDWILMDENVAEDGYFVDEFLAFEFAKMVERELERLFIECLCNIFKDDGFAFQTVNMKEAKGGEEEEGGRKERTGQENT